MECTWVRTWKVPAGPAKIKNWDLEKISPMRITVSCSAPPRAARFEKFTTRPKANQERASKRSSERACEMVRRPTAATVAIAKWHDPKRASANDCYAPSSRSSETSPTRPKRCHSSSSDEWQLRVPFRTFGLSLRMHKCRPAALLR